MYSRHNSKQRFKNIANEKVHILTNRFLISQEFIFLKTIELIEKGINSKDEYIQYLQDENKRLIELVATLENAANEKEQLLADERKRVQAEGIKKAKENGVKFGRPALPLPHNFDAVYRQWKNGEISMAEAARRVHMPDNTFKYKAEKYKQVRD